MAANGPVPTVEAFRASCTKPEAFSSVSDPTIAIVLAQETDILAAAFGDRAKLPITEWDGACDAAVFAFAGRRLMAYRGYRPSPEGDKEFVALAERAERFREGVKGKTEHPRFTDSTTGNRPDSPRILGAQQAAAWANRRRTCR